MGLSEQFDLWIKSLKPETGRVYGRYLRRLFADAKISPDEAISRVGREDGSCNFKAYKELENQTNRFTERGRHIAIYALRRFLYDKGVMGLPPAKIGTPEKVKPPTNLKWEQATAICARAGKPYSLIFRLMLHTGMGSGEFLKFNTEQNWQHIKKVLENHPGEYVRVEAKGRKKNRTPFYHLIPTEILKDILANVPVPIRASHGYIYQDGRRTHKTIGVPLDMPHLGSARIYMEKAFETALKGAAAGEINGKPSLHELRDCFRTQAHRTECDHYVAEFALGHEIDKLGYDKVYYDEHFVWENIKKIYGPTLVQIEEVTVQNKELSQRVIALENIVKTQQEYIKTADQTVEEVHQIKSEADEILKKTKPAIELMTALQGISLDDVKSWAQNVKGGKKKH
jgi:integrase/uncharacterized protein YbcI